MNNQIGAYGAQIYSDRFECCKVGVDIRDDSEPHGNIFASFVTFVVKESHVRVLRLKFTHG